MHYDEFLAVLRRDVEAVATHATGRLDATVPTCPGWSVADLLRHLGRVHWWAAECVRRASTEPVQRRDAPEPAEGVDLVGWYRQRAELILTTLSAVGPDSPAWTFLGPGHAAFWARRQANEVSVHRWDVERATVPSARPIDARVASDGIDEYLTVIAAVRGALDEREGSTLHVHCTDFDGEWLVRFIGGNLDVRREHAKGDVAARGTASDLVLALWGRDTRAALEVFGDADILDRLIAHVAV